MVMGCKFQTLTNRHLMTTQGLRTKDTYSFGPGPTPHQASVPMKSNTDCLGTSYGEARQTQTVWERIDEAKQSQAVWVRTGEARQSQTVWVRTDEARQSQTVWLRTDEAKQSQAVWIRTGEARQSQTVWVRTGEARQTQTVWVRTDEARRGEQRSHQGGQRVDHEQSEPGVQTAPTAHRLQKAEQLMHRAHLAVLQPLQQTVALLTGEGYVDTYDGQRSAVKFVERIAMRYNFSFAILCKYCV